LELIEQLELNEREEGPLAFIRRIRGTLLRRPRDGDPEVVAGGKADWVGWAELKTAPVDEIALLNTGRVIRDVDAHILAVIEAEDQLALKTFDRFVLDRANDERPQRYSRERRPPTTPQWHRPERCVGERQQHRKRPEHSFGWRFERGGSGGQRIG